MCSSCWLIFSLFLCFGSIFDVGIRLIVSITAIIIGFVCTIYIITMLFAAGNYRARTEQVVKKETMLYYSTRVNRVHKRYYFYFLWKFQLPAGIPCGSFFTIESSFAMAHLRELADNLVNAILLIQPYRL